MFYIYILQSTKDDSFYVGQTNALEQRIKQHNTHKKEGSKYTKHLQGSWKLVYTEIYETRSEAVKREIQIKAWKSKKAIQKLIDNKSEA